MPFTLVKRESRRNQGLCRAVGQDQHTERSARDGIFRDGRGTIKS
jgi:hypothetical protein